MQVCVQWRGACMLALRRFISPGRRAAMSMVLVQVRSLTEARGYQAINWTSVRSGDLVLSPRRCEAPCQAPLVLQTRRVYCRYIGRATEVEAQGLDCRCCFPAAWCVLLQECYCNAIASLPDEYADWHCIHTLTNQPGTCGRVVGAAARWAQFRARCWFVAHSPASSRCRQSLKSVSQVLANSTDTWDTWRGLFIGGSRRRCHPARNADQKPGATMSTTRRVRPGVCCASRASTP